MRIGFDAKRAFYNRSGLGNYSRFIIKLLSKSYQEHKYCLYTPGNKGDTEFTPIYDNIQVIQPHKLIHRNFPSVWRSLLMAKNFEKDQLDIYHGLSGELPGNITGVNIKTVVTIHDLIFLRYPELYNKIDRLIYKNKYRFACKQADKIIAISEQTRQDIIKFFSIDPSKIEVIYQSCHEDFQQAVSEEKKNEVARYCSLPDNYLLYVGTIEKRKNLLSIVKAIEFGRIKNPLVVIGKKTSYYTEIKEYIDKHRIKNVYFLSGVSSKLLPAIYQMAKLFIYPSVFEGFGIPVLEALFSKVPVITSKGGCFPEVGGPSCLYVSPSDYKSMADYIQKVLQDDKLRKSMITGGYKHAQKFTHQAIAEQLIAFYTRLLHE